uniref:PIN domain-containing protein n=1 Tax=Balaenoptera musculus TaxID=9771 RepID=A0A8C0DT32_BALMU
MLKSRTFLKKTRAGGVMKIVREHYLRDDIGCGASGCAACGGAHEGTVLEPQPLDRVSSVCPQPHYLLPDTNVLLHQVSGTWASVASSLRPPGSLLMSLRTLPSGMSLCYKQFSKK